MKKLFFFLSLLLWLTAGRAQTTLFGNVSDANGEPLPGATVVLEETDKGTIADSDGFFIFLNLKEGEYRISASYLGYEKSSQTVVVKSRNKAQAEFVLEKTSYAMNPVEITGSWANEQTPMTYSNVDREDLEKINLGQDVPFLLRWTPSVVATSDAGTGIGYTGIRIRGTDPSRINVSINGIPLNDSESQSVFWVNLPDLASSTEQIQIQRGVGTSTNGAGAFGATINLNTSKVHTKPYVTTSHSYGSFNTLKNNITAGSGLISNKFTLDGRLSRVSSDGYIDRGTADLYSYYFSAAYLGANESLRLNVFSGKEVTYQAWNGVPVQYIGIDSLRNYNSSGTEKDGEPHDNEVDDYLQNHYQLLYNRQLAPNWTLNLAAHYTRGKGFFEQYKGEENLAEFNVPVNDTIESDLIRRRWLDNHFYGITYGVDFKSEDQKWQWTIGGGLNKYEGKHYGEIIWTDFTKDLSPAPRYYDNDADKLDFNIYSKVNYQFAPKLNAYLDLQYRYINYNFLGVDDDGSPLEQEDQLHFFNPKVGVLYQLNDGNQIYASFGVANREPNRSDYTEANPMSRPEHETLYNTEVGFRQNWPIAFVGVNFYHMLYNNQLAITGQLNDVGEATRRNIKTSYRLGVELEGRIAIVDGLEFGTSLTLSQNKISALTEFIDDWDNSGQIAIAHRNTDLALSPNVILASQLSYDFFKNMDKQSLTLAFTFKYVGQQFMDNTSNVFANLPAYSFSDVRINYHLKTKPFKDLAITLLIQNVFDQKFSTNAWVYRYSSAFFDERSIEPYAQLEAGTVYNQTGLFPQAGRNFLVGLTLGF